MKLVFDGFDLGRMRSMLRESRGASLVRGDQLALIRDLDRAHEMLERNAETIAALKKEALRLRKELKQAERVTITCEAPARMPALRPWPEDKGRKA